jgi:Protein of unknown function (DUF3300)
MRRPADRRRRLNSPQIPHPQAFAGPVPIALAEYGSCLCWDRGSSFYFRGTPVKSLVLPVAATFLFVWSGLTDWIHPLDDARPSTQAAKAPKPEDMDKLLAPVALYPDQLLSQMLIAAQNPGKVAALNEWMASQKLTGSELQDAAAKSGFDGSFATLTLFPQVVSYMATQTDWTAKLGQAFTADPKGVFASIQRLRAKAQDAGKLKTNQQQQVETKTTSSGEQVIIIEPANPQVVYVPQYNPTTVYTTPTSSTVVIKEDDDDAAEAVAAGLIGFTAGIAIGAAIDNNYYYGPYGWHGGFNMYNDAWDDWYDNREDAREDWMDHREDMVDERGDRSKNAQEQRTERTETRNENRPETQAQRTQQQQNRQANRSPETQAQIDQRKTDAQAKASEARSTGTASAESRGYSGEKTRSTSGDRSGTKSDAFSGYSSGKSERSASQRGQSSRSSSRGGGSRRR